MAIVGLCFSILALPIGSFLNPRIVKNISEALVYGAFEDFYFHAKSFVIVELCIGLAYRFGFFFIYVRMLPMVSVIIGDQLISALSNKKNSFYERNTAGQVANTIGLLYGGFCDCIQASNLLMPLFLAFFNGASLWLVHPSFAIVNQIWFFGWIIIIWLLSERTGKFARKYYSGISSILGQLVDFLNNILFVRILHSEAQERRFFMKKLDENSLNNKELNLLLFMPQLWYGFGALAVQAINLHLILKYVKSGILNPADSIIILTTNQVAFSFSWMLEDSISNLRNGVSQVSEGLKILDEDREDEDENNPDLIATKGNIEFNEVDFGYKDQLLFSNQSIYIAEKTKVALVGYSGAGKSSFVNLIMRINKPNAGTIKIDGQNIAEANGNSFYKNISLIPQNLTLFNRTILKNIAYPNEGDEQGMKERVIEAAKIAMIHDSIQEMPEGYETVVTEGGGNLSGGQKQRILIARAILQDAPIFIMDEFTSAIDIETETKIWSNLQPILAKKTCIMITHRMQLLSSIDRILFFENGVIVEDGSFDELIKLNGKFAHLWNSSRNEADC